MDQNGFYWHRCEVCGCDIEEDMDLFKFESGYSTDYVCGECVMTYVEDHFKAINTGAYDERVG